MSLTPAEALRGLVEAGYFAPLPVERIGGPAPDDLTQWHRAVAPPKLRDLPWFVSCVKTLGSHSTTTAAGLPAPVLVRTGDKPHEVQFKLRSPWPPSGSSR